MTLLIEDAETTRQQYQINPIHLDTANARPCKKPKDVLFLYGYQHGDDTPIKDKLRYARLMAGLKQSELAERVGIDRVTLTRLENGDVTEENMKTDLLLKIAATCGFERTFCCNGYHKFLADDAGKKIKAYRKKRRLTQAELAVRFHVNKKTVASWEYNLHKPPIEILRIMFPEYFLRNDREDGQ